MSKKSVCDFCRVVRLRDTIGSQEVQTATASAGVGLVATEPHAIFDSERCSELVRLVLFCDFDLSGFDAHSEGIVIPTDHGAVRTGALAANCSIETCPYADFSGACAVAVGQRKTKATAGASANMVEAVKAA